MKKEVETIVERIVKNRLFEGNECNFLRVDQIKTIARDISKEALEELKDD
jgi:hypothetical protein